MNQTDDAAARPERLRRAWEEVDGFGYTFIADCFVSP